MSRSGAWHERLWGCSAWRAVPCSWRACRWSPGYGKVVHPRRYVRKCRCGVHNCPPCGTTAKTIAMRPLIVFCRHPQKSTVSFHHWHSLKLPATSTNMLVQPPSLLIEIGIEIRKSAILTYFDSSIHKVVKSPSFLWSSGCHTRPHPLRPARRGPPNLGTMCESRHLKWESLLLQQRCEKVV